MFNRRRSRAYPGMPGWSTLDELLSAGAPPARVAVVDAVDRPPVPVERVEPLAPVVSTADPPTPPAEPTSVPPIAAEDVATWEQAVDYVEWLVARLTAEGASTAEAIRTTAVRAAPDLAATQAQLHLAAERERADEVAEASRAAARDELVRDLRSVARMRGTTDDVATQVTGALAALRERHDDLDHVLRSLQQKALQAGTR